MRVIETGITRKDVITFCVGYDRRKKNQPSLTDLAAWPWNSAEALEAKLRSNGLKEGVLAAYKSWWCVELDFADLLDCAVEREIVDRICPGAPQSLLRLVSRGVIETAEPEGPREWWRPLCSGMNLPCEWALILRPAVNSERPAKWYCEDGSGRALALLRRILVHAEPWRLAFAYLGIVPDEGSAFIRSHPELTGGG